MKVGEWYTNPSSTEHYLIRVILVDEENDRDGAYKTFSYFFIGKNKKFGTKESVSQTLIKQYSKVKEKSYVENLEKYFKEAVGPTEEEQLDDFMKNLGTPEEKN